MTVTGIDVGPACTTSYVRMSILMHDGVRAVAVIKADEALDVAHELTVSAARARDQSSDSDVDRLEKLSLDALVHSGCANEYDAMLLRLCARVRVLERRTATSVADRGARALLQQVDAAIGAMESALSWRVPTSGVSKHGSARNRVARVAARPLLDAIVALRDEHVCLLATLGADRTVAPSCIDDDPEDCVPCITCGRVDCCCAEGRDEEENA